MPDQQRDVRADAGLELPALRREIHRSAAVRIRDDGGDALREERLPLAERLARESFGGVRVDVDEPGSDDAVAGIDDRACAGPRKPAHGSDGAPAYADVGTQPWIT